jgi:hypothetical protein
MEDLTLLEPKLKLTLRARNICRELSSQGILQCLKNFYLPFLPFCCSHPLH